MMGVTEQRRPESAGAIRIKSVVVVESAGTASPQQVRSRWRPFHGFLVGLLFLEILAHAFAGVWLAHSPDDYAARVYRCAEQPRDLVFVGGSTVAEGIDPEILGPIPHPGGALTNCYAVGLSGGTTSDVYFGARKACPTPPRVLVYGITASDINDSRHEPHGPHSLMSVQDVLDWRRTRPDAAEWVTRHYLKGQLAQASGVYQYRHGIRMWAALHCQDWCGDFDPEQLHEARRQAEYARALEQGSGYAPTKWFAHRAYSTMKAGGWVAPPFEYLARYRTGSHLKYLDRLIDWAHSAGTTVVLVDMPTTEDLEQRHPAQFEEYRRVVNRVAAEHGIPLICAERSRTGLTDDHFADLIHLNRPGAERFSAWLAPELAKVLSKVPR